MADGGVFRDDYIWGFNVAAFFGLPFRWSEARAWCFSQVKEDFRWRMAIEHGRRARAFGYFIVSLERFCIDEG